MKKRFITIAGKLGSGKSSTAKGLAEELGYEHYSTGGLAREIARDHGFDITEWNKVAEQKPELDHEIDSRTKELSKRDDIVMDSRLAFHFVPDSFKVFLTLDDEIAAKRIYDSLSDAERSEEIQAQTIPEMAHDLNERLQSEIKRYKELYGIDHHDHQHFDLIIDTGKPENDLSSVIAQVKEAYLAWLEE